MKLFKPSNPELWPHAHGISSGLRPFFVSSDTLNSSSFSSSSSSSSVPIDTLFHRISRERDQTVSIVPVLEKWIQEGKQVKHFELNNLIKQLRKYRRFIHALQISDWINNQGGYGQSPGDIGIRLDLISRVHGVEQAEKYFDSIPDISRKNKVYSALLHCYTRTKCLEKSEATMDKMKELGTAKTLSYNVMLKLYSQMEKHEKLNNLVQEMEKKGIDCDVFTFNILLNAHVAASNTGEMEKLLMKMEVDPLITMDWHTYVVAAKGYLKVGLIDKALTMLKRSEQLIRSGTRRFAYVILLTLYADLRKKDEVYRVWNLYKKIGKFINSAYLCMISSLMKLDDVTGAEKIWEEWVSSTAIFDIRLPKLMISSYSKKGLWEKAEAFVNKIEESGRKLDPSSWDHLATGYARGGKMKKAIETIKKAISSSKWGWKPDIYTLAACLADLKSRGDVEEVEELLKIAREHCCFPTAAYDKLKNLMNNRNLSTGALDQMETDDEILHEETSAVMEFEGMGSAEL